MSDKRFFDEINICRGICVILVVLGHVLTQSSVTGALNYVFKTIGVVIYSFHMHTFFVISGFLSLKLLDLSTIEEKRNYIKSRCERLLIPYFFMGLLYMPMKLILNEYSRSEFVMSNSWRILIGENPDAALWFLYVLFIISVIVCLVISKKNIYFLLVMSFLLYISTFVLKIDLPLLKNILVYLFYFILGIVIRLNYGCFKRYAYDRKIFALLLVCFVLSNWLIIWKNISLLNLISTISGIIICFNIAYVISNNKNLIEKGLSIIAFYSMDIYIISEPVKVVFRIILRVFNVSDVKAVVIMFAVTLTVPILVSKLVIRRLPLMRKLILGMK